MIFLFFTQINFAADIAYFSINGDFNKAFLKIENAELAQADSISELKGYEKTKNISFLIIDNYTETLRYALFQTEESFYQYLKKCQERLLILNNYKNTSEVKYVKSVLYFQTGMVNFLKGEKMDAAAKMLSAYRLLVSIDKNQPTFGLHKEMLGVFHVAFGYMPNSYIKMAKLIGIKADIKLGLQEISFVAKSNFYNKNEAILIKAGLQTFSNEKLDSTFETSEIKIPQRILYTYAQILLLQKQRKSKKALELLTKHLDKKNIFPLILYTKANLLLYKGDFKTAEKSFDDFIAQYKGENYLKDALYKKSLCKRLVGDSLGFLTIVDDLKNKGVTHLDADKKAQKAIEQKEFQHIELLKTMLFMDGGYYKEALEELQKIKTQSLLTNRDKVEYYYRTARINEALLHRNIAEKNYFKCIQIQADASYYFAPNAYLQLGNFYKKSDRNKATIFYKKVFSYKNHEYKNTLDNKAKSALKLLNAE